MGAIDTEAFESRLAAGFESLIATSDKSNGYLSLRWIQQALQFVTLIHDDVTALVPNVHKFLRRDRDANWLRRCVSDMEKLLQAGNILVKSITDLRYYQMFVQLALQSVQSKQQMRAQQLLNTCIVIDDGMPLQSNKKFDFRDKMFDLPDTETSRLSLQRARLDKCKKILVGVLEAEILPGAGSGEDEIFLPMLYGMRTAAIFVLLVLANGLTVRPKQAVPESDTSIKIALTKRDDQDDRKPIWFAPLMKLYQSMREEVVTRKANQQQPFSFLQELDEMDESVRRLGTLMHSAAPDLEATDKCVQALKSSLEKMDSGLPAIEAHLKGMNKMLASSRALALSLLLTC